MKGNKGMVLPPRTDFDDYNRPEIAQYLRRLRLARNWRQQDVARMVQSHYTRVQDLELGRGKPMLDTEAAKVAAVFGISLPELLARAGLITQEARKYLKKVPVAGVFFDILAKRGYSDERIRMLILRLDKRRSLTDWRN